MKSKKQTNGPADPWQDLAGAGAVQAVALDEVFAGLHVSAREAAAVKKGMLDELTRLAEGVERKRKK